MPTKLISKALLGALSAAMMAAPAFAGGNCAGGNCNIPVQVLPGYAPQFGPMTVQNNSAVWIYRRMSSVQHDLLPPRRKPRSTSACSGTCLRGACCFSASRLCAASCSYRRRL